MGIGFKELVVILVIVLVLFGAKRLKNIGADLGGAIKNFRKSVRDGDEDNEAVTEDKKPASGRVIEGEAHSDKEKV
jgi:sec-independent protein translocase protein TatA